jgi:hypothetical protein
MKLLNRAEGSTMKKLYALGRGLLLTTLITGFSFSSPQETSSTTIEQALETAKVRGKMVLVNFHSPG